MNPFTAAPNPADGPPWLTIVLAAIGATATLIAGILAYRSTRTAAAMTAQAQGQTATLESVDRRISEAFDSKEADNARLSAEIVRYQEREGVLLDRLARLEASLIAYKDQTDARIREQGERIAILSGELNNLRSSDSAFRKWAGSVILMYATLAERLHRATGEDAPDLPPSPPLT
jgi:hypothetical protein